MTSKPVRIIDWLSTARLLNKPANEAIQGTAQEAALEMQVLLAHVMGKPRTWVLAHPEALLDESQQAQVDALLQRRMAGEPLPYLLGRWEFYGLDFIVSPAVLIPRPETELLVERALVWLKHHPGRRAADIGTGSGCIAVTLAKHQADLTVLAVDASEEALAIAHQNAARHGVEQRINFVQGDLLKSNRAPLDLVCANLPYIPTQALVELPVAQHEPRLALDGGADGLQAIRALLEDAPRWLTPGGLVLLEMQYDQGAEITTLAKRVFPQARVSVEFDLSGLPRLVEVEREERE